MSKLVVCAVRDAALSAYMQPFFSPTVGGASRAFIDEVKRDESPMRKHSADYELFQLGEYDDETGKIDCLLVPLSVITGSRAIEM